MKKKIPIHFLSVLTLLLVSVGFVAAANTVTLNAPIDDQGNVTSIKLNASTDTNTINMTRGIFMWEVPGVSTSNTTIANITNHTDGAAELRYWNYTWTTTSTVDVNNMTIWIHVYAEEDTDQNSSDFNTGIDLDNGLPSATYTTGTFPNIAKFSDADSITIGASADSSRGIDNCIVFFRNTRTSVVDNATEIVGASNACADSSRTLSTITGLTRGETYEAILEVQDNNNNKTNVTNPRIFTYTSAQGAPIQVSTGGGQQTVFSNLGDAISNTTSTIQNMFQRIFNIIFFWRN